MIPRAMQSSRWKNVTTVVQSSRDDKKTSWNSKSDAKHSLDKECGVRDAEQPRRQRTLEYK
jgi:hypothetical protein